MFLDLDRLRNGRRLFLENDDVMASAVSALDAVRDQALHSPAQWVCDKASLAPSGDRHDFLSVPTYLWPDPSKED